MNTLKGWKLNMFIVHPVLLAGGSGTRLWPLSRKSYPKQFSNLIGEAISNHIDNLVTDLKSVDPLMRGKATAEAISIGVDPRLILSQQYFDNIKYRRHADTLPNFEKRARQLSAEYREAQKARPIDVVPVSQA